MHFKCEAQRLHQVIAVALMLLGILSFLPLVSEGGGARLIEVTADRDNRFKVPGQKKPVITVKANEVIRLRITSRPGSEWDKDGAVHSFSITALKDQGWDLRLKEGTQEFTLVAPAEPGEYVVECAVMCGKGHTEMKMKLVVTP